MCDKPIIISLMGPTASGKTQCAIDLFQAFSCDIISVDSAMVYRGMDIGTAKPTASELKKAPHRLIDLCDPSESYSAGQFNVDAIREITDIHQHNRLPLLVGGTMLYFNRLQRGIADLPEADPIIREQLNEEALRVGWGGMHDKLKQIDPKAATRIHPNDIQRIQRALEVYASTGETLSHLQLKQQTQGAPYHFINLILIPEDRSILRQRIAKRFEAMLSLGFLEEVEALREQEALNPDLPSMRAVGYRQAWAYLAGEYDYETMKERAIIASCQLAKRQLTWLRSWPNAHYFNSEDPGLGKTLAAFFRKLF